MSKTLSTKILLRNDTANNWTSNNPVLSKGEIGVQIDTRKFKFGDGTTHWNNLSYGAGADIVNASSQTAGLMSASDFTKLASITAGAQANVQSDWNAASGDAAILNKPTTLAGYGITDAMTATAIGEAISNAVSSAFVYKGVKASVDALPATGNKIGDIWHVIEDEGEYVWNGSGWDELGGIIDLSDYLQFITIAGITLDVTNNTISADALKTALGLNPVIIEIPSHYNIGFVEETLPQASYDYVTNPISYLLCTEEMKIYAISIYTNPETGDSSFDWVLEYTLVNSPSEEKDYYIEIDGQYNYFRYIENTFKHIGGSTLDVQINGTSIIEDGVANIPIANNNQLGVVKVTSGGSIGILNNGSIGVVPASSLQIKDGTQNINPITPGRQYSSTFYGLAKAAGDTTQSQSNNSVGNYTDEAKYAIKNMIRAMPNYTVGSEVVLIPETTFNFEKDGDNDWYIADFTFPSDWDLDDTSQITVTFDGVSYIDFKKQGFFQWNGNELKCQYIGNSRCYTDFKEENYPFCFYWVEFIENIAKIIAYTNDSTHVIKVVCNEIVPNYIEENYYKKYPNLISSGSGENSIRIGKLTKDASGKNSIVQGVQTIASGNYSHAQGDITIASGNSAHAQGNGTVALGNYSHAQGSGTVALGNYSHAQGNVTVASGNYSHAQGKGEFITSVKITGEKNATIYNYTGNLTTNEINGIIKISQDYRKITNIDIENKQITVNSTFGQVFNNQSAQIFTGGAIGDQSHVQGYYTTASGDYSHAEGSNTIASGVASHVQGALTRAINVTSHAQGYNTAAINFSSHTEGSETIAYGQNSHAQGEYTTASGPDSHAEGFGQRITSISITGEENATIYTYTGNLTSDSVKGIVAFLGKYRQIIAINIENNQITVDSTFGQALNNQSVYVYIGGASGNYSHVEGYGTTTLSNNQHAQGKFNVADSNNIYADIVGNGISHTERSNAFALSWTGDGKFAGNVYVGANSDSSGGNKLATEQYVNSSISAGLAASDAMVFKGTLGTNGTVAAVPTSGVVKGDTYKVITGGTWAGSSCKVGDLLIALNSGTVSATSANWAYVPSGDENVDDVQIDGSSIVNNGVANIPTAGTDQLGVVKTSTNNGIAVATSGASKGLLSIFPAQIQDIKAETNTFRPITPLHQHEAVFYGLTKAAGVDMANSNNAVGTYTGQAKSAIQNMLGVGSVLIEIPIGYDVNFVEETLPQGKNSYITDPISYFLCTSNMTIYHLTAQSNPETGQTFYIWNLDYELILHPSEEKDYYLEIDDVLYHFRYINDKFVYAKGQQQLVFEGTGQNSIIIGRGQKTASGDYSVVEGSYGTIASGEAAHAEGAQTAASGNYSHAEGAQTAASGISSHVQGSQSRAFSSGSHAQGYSTATFGDYSHVQGGYTIASGRFSHAEGHNNPIIIKITGEENATIYTYAGNLTSDYINSKIKTLNQYKEIINIDIENKQITLDSSFGQAFNNRSANVFFGGALGEASHVEGDSTKALGIDSHAEGFRTIASGSHSHAEGVDTIASVYSSHAEGQGTMASSDCQHVQGKYNIIDNQSIYADIVGNGQLVQLEEQRSNAYALTWTGDGHYGGSVYVNCNDDSTGGTRLPEDIQINGTSIVNNGVANIPVASLNDIGAVKVNGDYGINTLSSGATLRTSAATSALIKQGTQQYRPIVPNNQHESTFYGLAKAAGDTTQSLSDNAVGTYTNEAKSAIKTMLGVTDPSVDDVQINGTSIVNNGVANIPIANQNTLGTVKVNSNYGIMLYNNILTVSAPVDQRIKAGIDMVAPVVASNQHKATFYGLAKAAGDTTQSVSSNAVGSYTQQAKAAIQQMLGVTDLSNLVTYSTIVGDGTTTDFTIIHGLHSNKLVVQCYLYNSTTLKWDSINNGVYTIIDDNSIGVSMVAAPATDGLKVVIISTNIFGTAEKEEIASLVSQTFNVTVSGSTPTIEAENNVRYICGEVTSLDFTPCTNGICNVVFTSGSTVTILTLPSTVKMPEWFDVNNLETNYTYQISIADGVYGAVMSWPL